MESRANRTASRSWTTFSGLRSAAYRSPFALISALAIIAAFSPSKALGAASGGLVVLAALLVFPERRMANIRRLSIIVSCYLALAGLHWLLDPTTHVFGVALHLVTHAHLLLVAIRPDWPPSESDVRQVVRLATVALLIQAPLGMLQALIARTRSGTFDSANGDNVNGTIDMLVALSDSAPRGSNVMFSIALVSLSIVVLGFGETRRQRTVALLSLVTFVYASVVHLHLFLLLSSVATAGLVGLVTVRRSPRGPRWGRPAGQALAVPAVLGSVFIVAALALPQNYGTFRGYVLPEVENLTTPTPTPTPTPTREEPPREPSRADRFSNHKVKIAFITLDEVRETHPYQPFVGIGAGQFNSRAALIASGTYLEGLTIPEPLRGVSGAAEQHFMPLWLGGRPPWVGSAWFPFFSVQSLYAELGLLGLALIGLTATLAGRRIIRTVRHRPRESSAAAVLLLFLLGIGTFQNYWEWSQGVIVGVVLLWALTENLRHSQLVGSHEPSTSPTDGLGRKS